MPLEIRELHIKATVSEDNSDSTRTASESNGGNGAKEEIVKMCVEQVLQILSDKIER